MNEVKNPFAIDKTGDIIFINDLIKQRRLDIKNGEYYCMECNCELIVRMGDKNRWHFSHKIVDANSYNKCAGGVESALHQYAKKIIKNNHELVLTSLTIKECHQMHFNNPIFKGDFEKYLEESKDNQKYLLKSVFEENAYSYQWNGNEMRINDYIPDCIVQIGGKQLAVEILVTHSVDEQKANKVKTSQIDMIEIDLSDLTAEKIESKEFKLDKYILYEAPRRWIFKTYINSFDEQIRNVIYNEGKFIFNKTHTRNESELRLWKKHQDEINEKEHELYVKKLKQNNIDRIPKIIQMYVKMNQKKRIDIFNFPVKGEYAFKCEREVWQKKIFCKFIANRKGKFVQLAKINSYIENYSSIGYYKEFDFHRTCIWKTKYDAIKNYMIKLIQIGALRETSPYDNIGFYEDLEIICDDIRILRERIKKYDIDFNKVCMKCGIICDEKDDNRYYLFHFNMDKDCFDEYVNSQRVIMLNKSE